MKQAICLNARGDIAPEKEIELIHAAGFDGFFMTRQSDTDVRRARVQADRLGMLFASVHAPFRRAAQIWEPGDDGDRAIGDLIECLHDCARYAVPVLVVHAVIGFDKHTPTPLGVDRFDRLIDESLNYGVTVAFENTEGEEYLDTLMERYFSCPTVGFCYDSGHELCYNIGTDMIAKYGLKMRATHLNDNRGATDPEHITSADDLHLLPFDGIADWANIARRINTLTAYTGPLTFEIKHRCPAYAAMEPRDFYAAAYERAARVAQLFEKREN